MQNPNQKPKASRHTRRLTKRSIRVEQFMAHTALFFVVLLGGMLAALTLSNKHDVSFVIFAITCVPIMFLSGYLNQLAESKSRWLD